MYNVYNLYNMYNMYNIYNIKKRAIELKEEDQATDGEG